MVGKGPQFRTLYEMLGDRTYYPPLEDRFHLACQLSESIFAFLTSGWLHKTISAVNLLFFSDGPGNDSASFSLTRPYLSGFARSRMVNQVALTSMGMTDFPDTLYCHPAVMGGERRASAFYHALYDIYSFGIVLLEIGTWTRLESFYTRGTDGPSFQRHLAGTAVPQLGATMGSKYMNLVLKCIQGRFDGLKEFRGTERDYNVNLLRSFHWEVVSVLKSINV